MQFSYTLNDDFPPLAWVATCQPERRITTVSHGRFVETHPHFFVEGAWAGDFLEGQIHNSDTVFGSGGVLTEGTVIFVSCTATTDYLYHNDNAKHFVISNSLPLLLAKLDDELLTACEDYSRINRSIPDGISEYRPNIPTVRGHVRRIMHANVQFRPGHISLVDKPPSPEFQQYSDYRNLIQSRIGALFSNARDPARKIPMQIFSTQSRGYDSTAVNALAAPFGIDNIFTVPESKDKGSFYLSGQSQNPSDDGTMICSALGLPCTAIDRRSFEKGLLTSEEYYWAGLDNNQDMNLHEITLHISKPTLLLTGQYGEFWYTADITGEHRMHFFDDSLKKWDLAGHGLPEVRLKAGFVQMAIPVIGSRHRSSILHITESPEMLPWRLNTQYDRPIPRRIAEEAGVPREMFGQVKLASIVHLPSPNVPVTSSLRKEFYQHLIRNKLLSPLSILLLPLVQRINNWICWHNPNRYFHNRSKHPLLWHMAYFWSKLTGQPFNIRMIWTKLDSYLYSFSVNKVRDEYRGMLDSSSLIASDSTSQSSASKASTPRTQE